MKTKQLHARNLFFIPLLLLIFGLTNPIFSQPGNNRNIVHRDTNRIVRTNWTNSMGQVGNTNCIMLQEDNILLFLIKARFAAPSIMDADPMHFWYHYTLPSPHGTLPFYDLTDRLTTVHPAGTINGEPIWEIRHTVVIDLGEVCEILDNGFFDMEITFQLVTKPSPASVHMPYPYFSHPDLFPEDLFDIPLSGFSEEWTKTKTVCCYQASPPAPTLQGLANDTEQIDRNGTLDATTNSIFSDSDFLPTLRLFPSPFESQVSFQSEIKHTGEFHLEVFNTMGESVLAQDFYPAAIGSHEEQIETSHLSPGVYFFHFSNQNHTKVVKLVKVQ